MTFHGNNIDIDLQMINYLKLKRINAHDFANFKLQIARKSGLKGSLPLNMLGKTALEA